MDNNAVTKELISYALAVGEKMSKEYLSKGDYCPQQAWGCEGQIYPSLLGTALLELFKYNNNELFLNGVKAIIESNIKKQFSSGGWALSLGHRGNGIKFNVDSHLMEITSTIEDLPPTVTALRLMADYKILTSDSSYDDSMERGFRYLTNFWNREKKVFDEMLVGEALRLRAKPANYHIYSYLSVSSLCKIYPEAEIYVQPLYNSIKSLFEEMDEDTYPLLYAMHASLIIEKERESTYVKKVVKQRILEHIAFGSKFLIKDIPGALGHHDGLRGICLDEGHLRNSIGAALAMKFYDVYVESGCFTSSELYKSLTGWILNMYNDGLFYEFLDIKSGKKMGVGTPGQFLPIFWILGKF